MPIIVENTQKVGLVAPMGIDDYAHQKIWEIWQLFIVVNQSPSARTPCHIGMWKKTIFIQFALFGTYIYIAGANENGDNSAVLGPILIKFCVLIDRDQDYTHTKFYQDRTKDARVIAFQSSPFENEIYMYL